MQLMLAIKAFLKALKEPEKAKDFLVETTAPVSTAQPDAYHLRLLSMLQHSGRLLDFLKEDISTFTDAQVGAAVRQVHASCAKTLEELVTVRPLMDEPEGTVITVQKGYDPSMMKVVGKIKGEPPFKAVVRHRGWKAHKLSLPKQTGEYNRIVVAPAELEVQS